MSYYDSNARYDSGARYDEDAVPLSRKKMKVKLGLDRLMPEQKVMVAKTIKTAMTTNAAVFTAPNPTMTVLGGLITAAETAIEAYKTAVANVSLALTQRDDAVAAMCGGVVQEAGYVDSKSGGVVATIELAGMGVRRDSTPIGPMPQVEHLAVTAGDHDGELDLVWDPVPGASSYEIWLSPDPMTETGWKFAKSSPKSSAMLLGLTSATKVWVRVRAIGADPQEGPWSDPAVKVVP